MASLCVACATAAWELEVRSEGYGPSINDSPQLWAKHRLRAHGAQADQLVFLGSSRTLFDIDLDLFQAANADRPPIQLATVGTNPLPMLTDLAQDPSYAGTTIVGITPTLAALPVDPHDHHGEEPLKAYRHWSPTDATELSLALWLQARLAFINADDLTLGKLWEKRIAWPKRAGVHAPEYPDYGYELQANRRAKLIDKLRRDTPDRARLRRIWIQLMQPPPAGPDHASAENEPGEPGHEGEHPGHDWAQQLEQAWPNNLKQFVANVRAIQARAGRVIFVRLPSSAQVRELEARLQPRAKVWDALLRETGAVGIHFEDYPELRAFECPEWSHLGAEDSIEFTRRLIAIMQAQGLLPATRFSVAP